METEISALLCDESHLNTLIKLGETYYPKDNPALSAAFLKWFYIDNPNGPAHLVIAHEGDDWIGMMVMIPMALEVQGQSQKTCFAVNALSHPEHRTKNLFIKIIKATKDLLLPQNIWLLAHPNPNSAPGWKRQKMTFRDPLHLHLVKFKCPFSGTQVKKIKTLQDLQAIPSSFWQQLAAKKDVHLKYSPEFIAWRYLDAPHRKYEVSVVEKSGLVLGLIVTRQFKFVADLMVDCIAADENVGTVMASVYRPTLLLHSAAGGNVAEIQKGAWKLPYKRLFPFFVSTWGSEFDQADMNGITLGASDF